MDLKVLFLIQILLIFCFSISLYVIELRIESIEERKYNKNLNENEDNTGIIKNQYIVVLRENATFIDEFTRTNWIKKALDESVESYSKIIHYYSIPNQIGWNTPSESLQILKNNNIERSESFIGFVAKLSPDMYEYFVHHPSVKLIENDEFVKLDDIIENDNSDKKIFLKNNEGLEDKSGNNIYDDNDINTSSIVYKEKSNLNLSRLVNRNPITNK